MDFSLQKKVRKFEAYLYYTKIYKVVAQEKLKKAGISKKKSFSCEKKP
jgi:hypothetical protein